MRNFDMLVMKHVYGFAIVDHSDDEDPGECLYYKAPKGTCGPDCHNHEHLLPRFSEDISDAMALVEDVNDTLGVFCLGRYPNPSGARGPASKRWTAAFGANVAIEAEPALAIVKAVLKAKGAL